MRDFAVITLGLAVVACAPKQPAKRTVPTPDRTTATMSAQPDPIIADRAHAPDPVDVPIEPAAPELPPTVTFAAVGDIMLGSTFPDETGRRLPPDDGVGLLAEVTPLLSRADVAFGNLEGPLIDGGTSWRCERMKKTATDSRKKRRRRSKRAAKRKRTGRKQPCWAYRTPPRYAKHLVDAGFDVVSIANNHALDFGVEGRDSTIAALDQHGIAHSGPKDSVALLDVRGRTIAVIAFATADHSHNLKDIETAVETVAAADATADIVVVSFHGGAEGRRAQRVPDGPEVFYGEPRGDLRRFTHAVVDAGADLVLGHGPHVVRGMEIYNGRLIAYSLGNFATYRGFSLKGPLGLSVILEVTLDGDGAFRSGAVHPVRQPYPGGPTLDAARSIIPILRGLCARDFGDTAVSVADDGTLRAPDLVVDDADGDAMGAGAAVGEGADDGS